MSRPSPLLAAFLSLGLLLLPAAAPRPAQAEETPAYVALGNSIAFGVGATDRASMGYVGRTFDALRTSDRYRERGLTLVSLSVPGATSSDLLVPDGQLDSAIEEIERRRDDASSLDDNVEIITIDIGGNDLLSLISADSPCLTDASSDPCRRLFGQILRTLEANLTEVLGRLREAAPDATLVVVDLYNPYSGTGDLREVIADLGVAEVNKRIAAAAADPALRAEAASVFQLFQGRGDQWIASDHFHPNDAGHSVIAAVVLAAIEDHAPDIAQELLAVTPAPVFGGPAGGLQPASNGDGYSLQVLAAAVALAFGAGAVLSAAYFLARGRA